MQVVALSSSRVDNSKYLEPAIPFVKNLFGDKPFNLVFIPFASVGSYVEYYENVKGAFAGLPYSITMATPQNARELIEGCDGLMVGGGNTFKLLHDLYEVGLIELISGKVKSGMPYLGWSAGSNILGPTLCTTNDMPIVQPQSFKALNIFSFQINPHYHNQCIQGFNGETRDQRIEEFLTLNKEATVMALPEGSALVMRGEVITYCGSQGSFFSIIGEKVNIETIADGQHLEFFQLSMS